MVYGCLRDSPAYSLDYYSLDTFDLAHFAAEGRIRPLGTAGSAAPESTGDYDFWVFNWHFITMASHVDSRVIAGLPGLKFTVVLELAPDDPLKLVPPGVFDGYIALDPSAPSTGSIFPFPRPLEGEPRSTQAASRPVPVIGSFGYGTPGKGFELLVEAVNREFDRAKICVNIPTGTYVGTNKIHHTDYARYLAKLCARIAKPGIEVCFTHEFMSPEQLVDWCADNDLNCFMYTRSQPGLSATTDQAIMSGRPLLTLSNDTFRHIHRYIPPYPSLGLREAIQSTVPAVKAMQRDWSREAFVRMFCRMLASFGLLVPPSGGGSGGVVPDQGGTPDSLLLISSSPSTDDILDFDARLRASLGRSGQIQVRRVQCTTVAQIVACIQQWRPLAAILSGFVDPTLRALVSELRGVPGRKILLVADVEAWSDHTANDDGQIQVLQRKPVIPFFTVTEGLREEAAIWLLGFSAPHSNLEQVLDRIAADPSDHPVIVEVPSTGQRALDDRISSYNASSAAARRLRISSASLPDLGAEVISRLAQDRLMLFYRDPERADRLEDLCSLALITERPVVFTRHAPFPCFAGRETFVEDHSISELLAMGMAAHIRVLHDFGEWRFAADVQQQLKAPVLKESKVVGRIGSAPAVDVHIESSVEETLRLDGEAFVEAAYRIILGRTPDEEGRRHWLRVLQHGVDKLTVLAAMRASPEGRQRRADVPGIAAVIRRERILRIPVIGTRLRRGRVSRGVSRTGYEPKSPTASGSAKELLALQGVDFVDGAYQAVLGRTADEGGRKYWLDLLEAGTSKWTILARIRLSPEGRQAARQVPGLETMVWRHRLLRAPVLGRLLQCCGMTAEPTDLQRSLRVAENALYRLSEQHKRLSSPESSGPAAPESLPPVPSAAPEPSASVSAPVAKAPAVIAPQPRPVFLLVGTTELTPAPSSDFIRSIERTWVHHWGTLLVVLWDSKAKHLRLASAAERRRSGLQAPSVGEDDLCGAGDDGPLVVSGPLCGTQGWLLVPEPIAAGADYPLVEMNVILEARRLRLRSAFVFHGAEPLRDPRLAVVAAAHEKYMQTLLLADLLIPVSTLAATDLNEFFIQHQLAESVPTIRKIRPPVETDGTSDANWRRYLRELRGTFDELYSAPGRLNAVYYWMNPSETPETRRSLFASQFAVVLAERGVAVIPVSWDSMRGRFVPSAPPSMHSALGEGTSGPWAPWINPTGPDAPRWVLIPDTLQVSAFAHAAEFAKAHGLRIGALLHEVGGIEQAARKSAELAALAHCDKVLACSASTYAQFYRFLLSQRFKIHSAEDRFKVVQAPNEILYRRQARAPKSRAVGLVQVLVWTRGLDERATLRLIDAGAQAAARSDEPLRFDFVSPSGVDPVGNGMDEEVTRLAGARWIEEDLTQAQRAELLAESDFGIFAGPDWPGALEVSECLWQGVPCLVPRNPDHPDEPCDPGLVSCDMRDTNALVQAILDLTTPEWRRLLANEAINRPCRSWQAYAGDVATELNTDRLADAVVKAPEKQSRDVYASLINLRRRPKLSLCISTYKRAGWLGVNLRNIFTQIPAQCADLEVLVVDNASPDNTPDVVAPYLERSDFRYLRNPRNVGMLGNLSVTAQTASGQYIWIIGDDDLTRPGIIQRVLELIEQRPGIALIYMNYGYTSEADPAKADDLPSFLDNYNVLEPAGPDLDAPVKAIAAKCENFYTAIYSHVYRRDHALRSYCQDTSGRIFSTMLSCIPTAYYVLHFMPDLPAYWLGTPSLVVNSNVSWAAYGALLDLEQLPRAWDLAERMGTSPTEVDYRRSNRLWLIEMMWREVFENDKAGNSAYFSAARVLMRIKHLEAFDKHVATFRAIYEKAFEARHPAATMPPEVLFSAFRSG